MHRAQRPIRRQPRPLHPAGCSCAGHFLINAPNPRDLEDDILDYLRDRYVAEGSDTLVELVDDRRSQYDTSVPASFRDWLLRLPDQAMPISGRRFRASLRPHIVSRSCDGMR